MLETDWAKVLEVTDCDPVWTRCRGVVARGNRPLHHLRCEGGKGVVQRVVTFETSLDGASVSIGGVGDGGGELTAEGGGYLVVVGEGTVVEGEGLVWGDGLLFS